MKNFEYLTPSSVESACRILEERGEGAKALAGGQSLIPVMKMGLADINCVVDLKKIPNLSYIRKEGEEIAIGALTRHGEVMHSDTLRSYVPLLAETASKIGHTQIRNRGTVGGSICHADPSADLPPTMLTLDATMVLQRTGGHVRKVRAKDFFKGVFETTLEKRELLTEIRIPIPGHESSSSFQKLTLPIGGFALVIVSALLLVDADDMCKTARITIGGVTETPFRAPVSEVYLVGKKLNDENILSASNKSLQGVTMMEGLGYPAEFVEKMVKVYTKRALYASAGKTQGSK